MAIFVLVALCILFILAFLIGAESFKENEYSLLPKIISILIIIISVIAIVFQCKTL